MTSEVLEKFISVPSPCALKLPKRSRSRFKHTSKKSVIQHEEQFTTVRPRSAASLQHWEDRRFQLRHSLYKQKFRTEERNCRIYCCESILPLSAKLQQYVRKHSPASQRQYPSSDGFPQCRQITNPAHCCLIEYENYWTYKWYHRATEPVGGAAKQPSL